MCLASASIRQYQLFPLKSDHFFNRPDVIRNSSFHRWRHAQRLVNRNFRFIQTEPLPNLRLLVDNRWTGAMLLANEC